MEEIKDDTGWQDSEHGYMMRSYKIENFKPFSMEDLNNTWCASIPDGKGNVTNYGGHWIDGKMVEEWRETISDPINGFLVKLPEGTILPKYKWTDNTDGSKTWELIK